MPGCSSVSVPTRASHRCRSGRERGLIFPLSGVTWCTTPELALARDQGADLRVEHGVFVPWASEVRPFAEFGAAVAALRAQHPQGSLREQLIKTMGNAVYGKVAQGVSRGGRAGRASACSMPARARWSTAPVPAHLRPVRGDRVRQRPGRALAMLARSRRHAGLQRHDRRRADHLPLQQIEVSAPYSIEVKHEVRGR